MKKYKSLQEKIEDLVNSSNSDGCTDDLTVVEQSCVDALVDVEFEKPCAEGESKLVNEVMAQMENQIHIGDWTAIDELLRFVPRENLIHFLPEKMWKKYKNNIKI